MLPAALDQALTAAKKEGKVSSLQCHIERWHLCSSLAVYVNHYANGGWKYTLLAQETCFISPVTNLQTVICTNCTNPPMSRSKR